MSSLKFLKDFDMEFKREVVDLYKSEKTFDDWYQLAEKYKKFKKIQKSPKVFAVSIRLMGERP